MWIWYVKFPPVCYTLCTILYTAMSFFCLLVNTPVPVVGLERGPFSFVSTIEELLGRNSSGFGLENREYGRGDPLRWPRDTLYPQKFALTSPTLGGRSVGIVRLRTKTTEFVCCLFLFVD
jgi:hypothetical protein